MLKGFGADSKGKVVSSIAFVSEESRADARALAKLAPARTRLWRELHQK